MYYLLRTNAGAIHFAMIGWSIVNWDSHIGRHNFAKGVPMSLP